MTNAQLSSFFGGIRGALFGGALSQAQVDGIGRLLSAWERFGTGDRRHLAYVLATAYHETGRRMQPVRETYAETNEQAASRLEAAWRAGRLPWVRTPYWRRDRDGKYWFGRGDVQLTHPANYCGVLRRLVLGIFGVDICADPDAVLRPDVSAFIIIEGMIRGETDRGDFTGKALEDYIAGERCDYVGARRIVNGTDRARDIASYARIFESALHGAGVPVIRPPAPDRPAVEAIEPLRPRPALPIPSGPIPIDERDDRGNRVSKKAPPEKGNSASDPKGGSKG